MWAATVILSNAEIQTKDNSQPDWHQHHDLLPPTLQPSEPERSEKDHRADKIGGIQALEKLPNW